MQDRPIIKVQGPQSTELKSDKHKPMRGKRQQRRNSERQTQKKKIFELNRVPDETKNLEDTVCNIDTNYLLVSLGSFKLLLVVPLVIVGIILISIRTSSRLTTLSSAAHIETFYNGIYKGTTLVYTQRSPATTPPTYSSQLGNDSLAPVWTAVMMAASAATDFITVWKRRGFSIVAYMLVSTVSFVASILCIEYDRIGLNRISSVPNWGASTDLQFRLYLCCVIIASIGVATGILTIYVGTRMAALEQRRMYMEREGQEAVLRKKDNTFPVSLRKLIRKLNCDSSTESMVSLDYDLESLTIHNEITSANLDSKHEN
uniref:Transmembrane protein 196 n=1 Tax=Ciona savignyi TaxID=51511 RepID=H2YFA3_CIOSA